MMGRSDQPKASEIAEELLSAASHGENLMREVDFMSGHNARLKQDVFKEMVGKQGEFPNVRLIDGNGRTVTPGQQGWAIAKIVQVSSDGKEHTLYDASGDEDAARLMNADSRDVIASDQTSGKHPQDVDAFVKEFKKTIDQLVASGKRVEGEGLISGIINDMKRAYVNGGVYDCADQGIALLSNFSNLSTSGNWDLHLVGAPPHYTVEVVPHSKDDPLIKLDPWRGEHAVDIVPAGTFKPDKRINKWLDGDGRWRWN
jgi:hypothetical protein